MKEILIDELKKLQMEILDHVDVFCRQNNIKYTLSGGTLLGAVRHGGYIPWDDDVDIQMTRAEYERFTHLWNTQGGHSVYELVNIKSGNNMGYPFGKIHNVETITYIGKLKRTGVYIDVFPVDKVVDDVDFQLRHDKIRKLYKNRSKIFAMLRRCPYSFFLKKTYAKIARKIDENAQRMQQKDCALVFEMVSGLLCKKPIPISVFDNYADIRFEDKTYMAVQDPVTYLTCTFGDYMTLPPEEKRVSHHEFVAYWK